MTTPRFRLLWLLLLVLYNLFLCFVSSSVATSTVYFRQQSGGSIFALDGRDSSQTELEDSDRYARFVGMTLHRRLDRLFWSDGRVISSASATDGSNLKVVVGALARVVWIGTNFGQTQADVQTLTVSGVPCMSILSWSPSRVECLVGLPQRFSQEESPLVSENDCTIQTTQGAMTGFALNYHEMVAAGYPSPIVERLDIEATFILPHALTIDDREGHDWLYWSNSADGRIYRSHLQSTAIDVLQERRWSVRGLALSVPSQPPSVSGSLFFSLESKGTISQLELPSASLASSPLKARIVLSGLRSPRGLVIDSSKQMLFFTEKTGRIYQARLESRLQARQQQQTLLDDASIVASGIDVWRIITRPSIARLDGIAVDSKYVYWCETNTNVIARAARRDFQPQILVGATANSHLSWPRSIALRSEDGEVNEQQQDFFYSEYTGRISRGSSQTVLINELRASSMLYLDSLVQQSAVGKSAGHVYLYALE